MILKLSLILLFFAIDSVFELSSWSGEPEAREKFWKLAPRKLEEQLDELLDVKLLFSRFCRLLSTRMILVGVLFTRAAGAGRLGSVEWWW